jgi:hypothetical protein
LHLEAIGRSLKPIDADLAGAVAELADVWRRPVLGHETVRSMRSFGPLFGRETVYVSFTRQWSPGKG